MPERASGNPFLVSLPLSWPRTPRDRLAWAAVLLVLCLGAQPLGATYNAASVADPAGRITERSTSEGTTGYQYDGDGRITRLTAPDGRQTTYAYDAGGRNTRSAQPLDGSDKLVTERRYDAADRQVAIAHSKQGTGVTTLIAGQAIARGPGGAVARIDSFDQTASFDAATDTFTGRPSRVQTFAYDANARLTAERAYQGTQLTAFLADSAAQATIATTYAYDLVGNRTTKTVSTPTATEATTYAYDSNDHLTAETLTTATGSTVTTTYTWDGNGNLASKTTPSDYTGYTFDGANRLIEVQRGASRSTASSVARYGYDADGQRIRKDTPAGTTHYLIDPTTPWPQVVLEQTVTPSGTQATAYVWGDQLRQQTKGSTGTLATAPGETLIPLPGHLGTTIAAIDQSGSVVERYEASAWGELANLHPRANHQYTGEYWDADARLTYLRARWQEPKTGRLLSIDPALGKPADPRTATRYGYASADPVNHVDPSGKESLMSLSIAFSALSFDVVAARAVVGIGAALLYPYVDNAVRSTIWDLIVLANINATIPNEEVQAAMDAAAAKASHKTHKGSELHHTIPKYLCGAEDQERSLVTYSEHQQLHAGLSIIGLAIEKTGTSVANMLHIPFGRRRASTIQTLGTTLAGRVGIGRAIEIFYTNTPAGEFGSPLVLDVFLPEQRLFVGGKTSCN